MECSEVKKSDHNGFITQNDTSTNYNTSFPNSVWGQNMIGNFVSFI